MSCRDQRHEARFIAGKGLDDGVAVNPRRALKTRSVSGSNACAPAAPQSTHAVRRAIGRWTDLHVGQRRQAPPIARDKLDAWRRVPPSSDRCVVSALRRGSPVLVNIRFASRVISTRSIAWKTPRCVRTSLVHHDGGMQPNQIPAAERCQQRSHARAMLRLTVKGRAPGCHGGGAGARGALGLVGDEDQSHWFDGGGDQGCENQFVEEISNGAQER